MLVGGIVSLEDVLLTPSPTISAQEGPCDSEAACAGG